MFANVGYIGFLSSSGYSPSIQSGSNNEEEDDGRTEIIYAVSEIGIITDFIKAHPMYTIEDYKWALNPRFIRIMCIDNTRIHYLSEKEKERRKSQEIGGDSGIPLSDLGIPIFGELESNN